MCEQFGPEEILDHLQGRLAPEREAAFREHLSSCPECRKAEEDLRSLARLSEAPPVQPRPEVDRALRAFIEEEAARRRTGSRRRIRLPFLRRLRRGAEPAPSPLPGLILAAAAALLLAVATHVLTSRKASPRPAESPVAAEAPSGPAPPPPEPQPPRPEPPRVPEPAPEPERAPAVRPPAVPPPTPPAPAPRPPDLSPPAPPSAPAPTIAGPRGPAPRIAVVAALGGRTDRAGIAAAEGTPVNAGDSVLCRTGTALLEFPDRSRLALRADTLVALEDRDGEVLVRLTRGEIACRVVRRENRFSVETPHGTAVVKGTVFSVRTGTLTSTAVTVAEGRVEARTAQGTVLVLPGHQSFMSGGAPSKPQPAEAEASMAWAFKLGLRARGAIWIPAASPKAELHPPMTAGRFYAEGSLTGLPIYSPSKTRTINGRANGGWASYTVDLPQEGEWFLWGRFYYPGKGDQIGRLSNGTVNDPNSFWVSVDGGDEMEFGNLKYDPETGRSYFQRWHWDGDGTIEVGKPAPLPLGRLNQGRHTLRVRERESFEDGELRLAPRLDMLCLTPDPHYVPHDEDARK